MDHEKESGGRVRDKQINLQLVNASIMLQEVSNKMNSFPQVPWLFIKVFFFNLPLIYHIKYSVQVVITLISLKNKEITLLIVFVDTEVFKWILIVICQSDWHSTDGWYSANQRNEDGTSWRSRYSRGRHLPHLLPHQPRLLQQHELRQVPGPPSRTSVATSN